MKNKGLFIIAIILASQTYAQTYIKIGGAYNKSLGGAIISSNYSINYNAGLNSIIERRSNVRSSLGKGLLGSLTLGRDFTDYVGGEITFSKLRGGETNVSTVYQYYNGDDVFNTVFQGSLFSITPSLIFSYEVEGVRPYLSLGIPINFISFNVKESFKGADNISSSDMETKYTGSLSLGVSTKIGLLVHINSKLSLFGELAFTYSNFSPNEAEVTAYVVNGGGILFQV